MNSRQNSLGTSHNQSFSIEIKLPIFAAQALNVKKLFLFRRNVPQAPQEFFVFAIRKKIKTVQ